MNNRKKQRLSFTQKMIRELIEEEGLDLSSVDEEEEKDHARSGQTKAKRGRTPFPEKWTRVISIYKDDLSKVKAFDLGPELLFDQSLGGISQGRGRPAEWKPIFWPPHLKKQDLDFTTAGN